MATSLTRLIGPWLLAAATALPAMAQQAPCRIGAPKSNGQMTTAADCVPGALRQNGAASTAPAEITETFGDLSPTERREIEKWEAARRAGTATTPPQSADPAAQAAVKAALTPSEETRKEVGRLLGLPPPHAGTSPIQGYPYSLSNGSGVQYLYKGMPFEQALRP